MTGAGSEEETDVVVAGCGFAGAVAAIAAADAGARVVLIEKMPDPGGISVCSFGGVRVAEDADKALAYLKRTNAGAAADAVLDALATGMTQIPARLARLADDAGVETIYRAHPANYPFGGNQTFGFVEIAAREGVDLRARYPHVEGAPGGLRLFDALMANLATRHLAPRCRTRLVGLLFDADRAVTGIVAEDEAGRRRNIRAGGVVLACGGFEGDVAMQRQYWPEFPVLTAAFRGNTGDGIRIAQTAGADLWHMWHYHGSYGFRHPDPAYPFGIRTKRLPDWQPGAAPDDDVHMPWILLDRRGRRFMNEYDPYLQDTGARPFARYDPQAQDFAAIPAWLVADADGASLWPFGRPTWHERSVGFDWGADNARALAAGILRQAETLEGLAEATGVAARDLERTLGRWNDSVAAGCDDDWGRPPSSMARIVRPPFIYAPVWPIVSNTQSGPVHDERQRVMRPDGSPIHGLYAAGELGSIFGHLYMSGGNIAECFIGGEIAGREAARARRTR